MVWIHNTQAFGNNIRLLRRAAGMTQEQVAAQLQLYGFDMSRSSYSQIECGTHSIRIEMLIALKKIFCVSYDAFFAPLEKE